MRWRPRLWLPIWFTRRFLYCCGVVAVVLAASPGLPPLVFVAIIAAIVLVVATLADAFVGPSRTSLTLARVPTGHFALRVPGTIDYTLENRSPQPVHFGVIETPVGALRFDVDDVTGDAPARSRATVERPVTPLSRGSAALGTLYAWYENRFGLLRRRMRIDASQPFRVYPDLSAVERYGRLHVRNRLIEAGLRKMRLRGAGTEFESLREWSTGDEFRAIDWKATARRGKLMVTQHEIERSQNIMLLLDCGRLMTPRLEDQRKMDFAVTAALSVASIAGFASDKVGLVAFARDIIAASAPRATRSSIARLSELMFGLEPRFEESNYSKAFAYLRTHLHKRSLVIFFTDVIDPIAQSAVLAELGTLSRRNVVLCVFMNDRAIERTLEATPRDAKSAYETAVAIGLDHERRGAAATLAQRGIIVIDVPARKLTTALIDEYLRIKQRGLI